MPMTSDDVDKAVDETLALFDKHATLMTLPQYEHAIYQVIGNLKDRLNALTSDQERLGLDDE